MKNSLKIIFSIALVCFMSCGSDDGGGEDPVAAEIGINFLTAIDAENAGNASDIKVQFNPSENEEAVGEYRIIVAKQANAGNLTVETASALGTGQYFSVSPTGNAVETLLPETLTDSDGEAIAEMVQYQVLVLTVADANSNSESHLFLSSTRITLAKTDILETMVELPIGTGGVAVDADGNIYCADFGPALSNQSGDRIYKITPEGEASVFATGFQGASGNTFGPDGYLYQSNISGGTISKVSPIGDVSEFASGMAGPVGLIFDKDGNLYVANCSDNTIKRVTPEGDVSTYASGTLFQCPNGIAIDNNGILYVANFSNGNIIKVEPGGQRSVLATLPGNNNGHITFYRNRLYVVDRGGNQIYGVSLSGAATIFAGSGQRGHADGPTQIARFSLPNDLGFSPDGQYLYVNDVVSSGGTDIAPTFLKRIRIER